MAVCTGKIYHLSSIIYYLTSQFSTLKKSIHHLLTNTPVYIYNVEQRLNVVHI